MDKPTTFVDYYETLQIAPNAEPQLIRQAYIRLAKQHHPDVGGISDDMERCNVAYRTLMSPSSRKVYDRLHEFHTGNTATNYREVGVAKEGSSLDDMSDDEIDSFINSIFAEYHNQPKPKKSLLKKFQDML